METSLHSYWNISKALIYCFVFDISKETRFPKENSKGINIKRLLPEICSTLDIF